MAINPSNLINVGTSPNDGQGDVLLDAFIKTNNLAIDLDERIIANQDSSLDNTNALLQEVSDREVADTTLQDNIDSLDGRVVLNDVKVGITTAQSNEIIANNSKAGITTQQAGDISLNNVKVGITTSQTNEIIANNLKIGYTEDLVSSNTNVVANTSKVGITTTQASNIVTNNGKVGISIQQANDIVTNNGKVGITTSQANEIIANNAKVSDINHVTIELPNVDNTSDVNKPISIAAQSALDLKVDTTENELNTENIFKSVSFAMDYSDRVRDDSGTIESRECVMNEYLKIIK